MKGGCLSAVINAGNLAVEGMDRVTIGVQSAQCRLIGKNIFAKECELFFWRFEHYKILKKRMCII